MCTSKLPEKASLSWVEILIEKGFSVFLYFNYDNRAVRNQVTILLPTHSLLTSNSAHTS